MTRAATRDDWIAAEPFFRPAEFRCPDKLDAELLAELVAYRRYLGRRYPGAYLVVTSDCREQGEPVKSGGRVVASAEYSRHFVRGGVFDAVDVVPKGVDLYDAFQAAERFYFGGLGVIYPEGALHLDMRPDYPGARWGVWKGKQVPLNAAFWNSVAADQSLVPLGREAVASAGVPAPLLGAGAVLVLAWLATRDPEG